MANVGTLTAEIGLPVWVTPAHFNGFRIFASLLQQRHWLEANQTLHDVWPSPGLIHYIDIFGGSCPLTEFCQSVLITLLQKPMFAHALFINVFCLEIPLL